MENLEAFDLKKALAGEPVMMANKVPVTDIVEATEELIRGNANGNLMTWYKDGRYFRRGYSIFDLKMQPKL